MGDQVNFTVTQPKLSDPHPLPPSEILTDPYDDVLDIYTYIFSVVTWYVALLSQKHKITGVQLTINKVDCHFVG